MRLLVAALDSELQAFPATLPGWARLVTGPGKLLAAVGLDETLLSGTFSDVVVIGTAGSVDPGLGAGVFEIGAALQHDVTDLDGVVGQHVSLPARLDLGNTGQITIATGDSFVNDATLGAEIRALGAQLLDMETYAYVWVAKRRGVPIRVIKSVSDNADEGSEKLWDEVVSECSRELWDWFRREFALED